MKYFFILTSIILILYFIGFVKRTNNKFEFMSRNFTTAIKGFAILTVVWAHGSARLGVGGIQFIAGVGVSLFLICSGYGLEMSYQSNGLKKFWEKRILAVCIPFWIVALIGLIVTEQFAFEKFMNYLVFAKPTNWFIPYILICYLIFYIFKLVLGNKSKKLQMFTIFLIFTFWFIVDSLFFANDDMPFLRARQMYAFPLGLVIADYKPMIIEKSKGKLPFIVIGGGQPQAYFLWE
ncbi:MAG: acyltransferase family protein [Oscillospiraceae bacterium]